MSEVKILALSDPHFHGFKQHSRIIDGVNSRFLDQVQAWERAIEIGKKEGCIVVVIPGDFFDVRGSIKPSIYNPVTRLIQRVVDAGMDLVIIPGNHDMEHFEYGETAVDSWQLLSECASHGTRCHVISGEAVAGIATVAGGKLRIGGIPYKHETGEFKAAFIEAAKQKPDVILIHQGVDDFNDGSYPETGLSERWLLDHFDGWVLCGHYHNPIWHVSSRVLNVGALVQQRASDEGQLRGVWTLTANGSAPKFHAVQAPTFVTVEAGFKEWHKVKGNFVRIKAKSVKEGDKLREKATTAGASSIVVHIEREFSSSHEKPVVIASPREMLQQYLDVSPKHKPKAAAILDMFDRVCES